jgi:protein KTI12
MPLIIFTGLPASGKSTRAQQLRDYFSTTKKVTILSENDIAKKKNDIHAGTFMFYT